jgi:hypothetical protein
MLSRRSLLISTLAAIPLRAVRADPGGDVASPANAGRAAPPKAVRSTIELRRGTPAERGMVAKRLPPAYDEIAQLGGRLRPRHVRVVSRDNANTRFAATFEVGALGDDAAYLRIDGRWWAWSSMGGGSVEFTLERDTAERVAAGFGVAVERREAIDGVALAWQLPATATVGAPAIATLSAENRTALALRLSGGYEALEIGGGRDDLPKRVRGPGSYAGPLWSMPLPPGGRGHFAFALERLLEIDRPGRYVVSLRYRGQLTRGLELPTRYDAARWDVEVAEQGAIWARASERAGG